MRIAEMTVKFFKDPAIRFGYLGKLGLWNTMPDKEYLEKLFKLRMGYELDLENPKTFNEKMQWLKLYDRRPEYTTIVDKCAVKKWVADRIGEEYIIPTLGEWDSPDEIDFDSLPDQFVLKCNHNSGLGMCICKDKSKLDIAKVKNDLRKGLKENYYLSGREWPYKNVPRKILAEAYLTDEPETELKDYKAFNFDRQPKLIQIDSGRFTERKRNLYSTDWQYIEEAIRYPTDPNRKINDPKRLDKMLELAHKLSAGYPHICMDFYSIDDKILFGELTLYHGSGLATFAPPETGQIMGEWLHLPSGGCILKNDDSRLYVRFEKAEKKRPYSQNTMISPPDCKIYCFDGKARLLLKVANRDTSQKTTYDYFDEQGNWLDLEWGGRRSEKEPELPARFEELKKTAEKLAKDLPCVRVDLYIAHQQIYFGEMTFYDGSGFQRITPQIWDTVLGNWLTLPERRKDSCGR